MQDASMGMHAFRVGVWLALAAVACGLRMESYSIPLLGTEKRCFFEDVREGWELFCEFQIVEGRRSIDFSVRDAVGEYVYRSPGYERTGERKAYMITRTSGAYQFCFTNSGGYKAVRFSVQVSDPNAHHKETADYTDKDVQILNIFESLQHVTSTLNAIEDDQIVLQGRERAQEHAQQNTYATLMFLFVMQLAVIVITSLGQKWYLTSLFNTRYKRAI